MPWNLDTTTVALDNEKAGKVERLIEMLDDNDDVQNVWHNAEFPEGWGEEE